jgi:hypothetical protein
MVSPGSAWRVSAGCENRKKIPDTANTIRMTEPHFLRISIEINGF